MPLTFTLQFLYFIWGYLKSLDIISRMVDARSTGKPPDIHHKEKPLETLEEQFEHLKETISHLAKLNTALFNNKSIFNRIQNTHIA